MKAWNVWLEGNQIDTVFWEEQEDVDAEAVKKSLIEHDGYDEAIVVKAEPAKHYATLDHDWGECNMDCGCRMVRGGGDNSIALFHCALHDNAEKLLEACEATLAEWRLYGKMGSKGPEPAYVGIASAAIKAAKGESDA